MRDESNATSLSSMVMAKRIPVMSCFLLNPAVSGVFDPQDGQRTRLDKVIGTVQDVADTAIDSINGTVDDAVGRVNRTAGDAVESIG